MEKNWIIISNIQVLPADEKRDSTWVWNLFSTVNAPREPLNLPACARRENQSVNNMIGTANIFSIPSMPPAPFEPRLLVWVLAGRSRAWFSRPP
jgi:hypothetical protein